MEKPEITLSEYAQMYQSEPWKAHMERISQLVEEAHEECFKCAGSLETRGLFQLRWQQREAIYRASMIIAEDTIRMHQEELEQFKRDFEALSREAE